MKKFVALFLAVVSAFTLSACSTGGDTPKPTVTPSEVVGDTNTGADTGTDAGTDAGTDTTGAPVKIGVSIMELTAYTWYLGVIDGCKQWAAENPDANFEFQFNDSRSDVSTMLSNIENLVTWGAEGIILFPADASSAIPTMKDYVGKGIPFIVGDYAQEASDPSDVVWSTFVGHDMKALGQKSGEVAVEYLKTLNKPNPVCVFITRPTSGQVSKDRFDGFKETVLAAFPEAKVIEEGDTGAGSADSAQSLMENVMQREQVIDVVSGHNDAEVVGAYNAAVAANRTETKFIGIAGSKEVISYVADKNPAWLGEVLQDPVVLGRQACDAIYRALKGETLPEKYDLPQPEALTPENIDSIDWKSWSWL